jgi:hypothetical protein
MLFSLIIVYITLTLSISLTQTLNLTLVLHFLYEILPIEIRQDRVDNYMAISPLVISQIVRSLSHYHSIHWFRLGLRVRLRVKFFFKR